MSGWSNATVWWVLAGVLLAVEMLVGTFDLLMIALGMAAGAVAAHAGAGTPWQILAAAVVGGGLSAFWLWRRRRSGSRDLAAHVNRDVNIDIGEPVHVDAWMPDHTTRVQYRGSTWTARLAPGASAVPGRHRVAAVEGNWLVLAPAGPLPG